MYRTGLLRAAFLWVACRTATSFFVGPLAPASRSIGSFPGTSTSISPSTRPIVNHASQTTTSLRGKLWDRLQIEEDPEPFWYLLNCIAGLEIDLLRQCREVCKDMPDAIKFVVPSEKKTRSHGANRMVTETKVKYQGYVFAKLRLCDEVYEAIQSLDNCRSWMGTVNRKGYKKLPPSPVALNELEVENFGLEDEEFEEKEEEDGDIIVDSEDDDDEVVPKSQVTPDELKVYLGLKVEDMVKVTKKSKFFAEDGIVRRLKDGKIMVRFFTYGSEFDEWMEPGDVRVLTNTEIVKGLSGPSKPITQEDFDGPGERGGDKFGSARNRPGNMRGNLMGQVKGVRGERNRRVDRDNRGDRYKDDLFGRTAEQKRREEDNWNSYKENQRAKKGGPGRGQVGDWDNEWTYQSKNSRNQNGDRALGDVDSQWGRPPSQRQQRRDKKAVKNSRDTRDIESAIDGADDWSSFVSDNKKPAGSSSDEDAFFTSLMNDLSDEADSKSSNANSGSKKTKPKDDDDFFASLVDELAAADEGNIGSQKSADDDFFAALEAEMGGTLEDGPGSSTSKASIANDDTDDFFAKLEAEMMPSTSNEKKEEPSADDFFANLDSALDAELNSDVSPPPSPKRKASAAEVPDFFDSLESALEAELSVSVEPEVPKKTEASKKKPAEKNTAASSSTAPASSSTSGDLSKNTVPVLKDMLRERGLKVSGKKAELIERLQQS